MPKYLLDLWLDGYETEEEMVSACDKFIDDQLNITASSLKFERITEDSQEAKIEQLNNFCKE